MSNQDSKAVASARAELEQAEAMGSTDAVQAARKRLDAAQEAEQRREEVRSAAASERKAAAGDGQGDDASTTPPKGRTSKDPKGSTAAGADKAE